VFFYRFPFVYITILLILGIEFQSNFDFETNSLLVALIVALIVVLILEKIKRAKNFQLVGIFLVLTMSASLLMSLKQKTIYKNDALNLVETVQLKIDEIAGVEKVWRKAICRISFIVREDKVQSYDEKVLVYFNTEKVIKGDVLIVHTQFSKIYNKGNPGEFDAVNYWKSQGIQSMGFVSSDDYKLIDHENANYFSTALMSLQENFKETLKQHLEGENLAIAQALVLGDKNLLSPEVKSSFSKAGAMHVLAVSGLHVGIVLFLLMYLFSLFPRIFSKRGALIAALIIIWIYAGVTGFSSSVLRATIMFSILTFGGVIGRKTHPLNLLFFSAFLMIAWNPLVIYNIGFQLSYLAMIGIFTLYKPISLLFYFKNKWIRKIWEGTAVGIAAQCLTFPLTLYYFHQFPNYFALTNIGMMTFAGVVLSLGLFLFTLNKLIVVGKLIGVALGICLSAMLFFIQFIENLPFSVAKGFVIQSELVLIAYCIILIFYLFQKKKSIYYLVGISTIALFSMIQFNRYQNLGTNELVVFNSKDMVITVKSGNKMICYHDPNERSFKNAQFLVGNYEKIKPAEIEFRSFELGKTSIQLGSNEIVLTSKKEGVRMDVNGEEFIIRKDYKWQKSSDETIIDMPYIHENPKHIQLKNGAFVFKLN